MNINFRGSTLLQKQEQLLDDIETLTRDLAKYYMHHIDFYTKKRNTQKRLELQILYEEYLFYRNLRVKFQMVQENYCDYHGHYIEAKCPKCAEKICN
jgi:hypothetical protein